MSDQETGVQQEVVVDTHQDGEVKQFLSFTLGEDNYGVDLMSVQEIKGWAQTTSLPNSPDFMKGVINLRGIVIPIFDLRKRFDMGDTEPNEKHAVIIVTVGERVIGILVDAVSDILDTNANDISRAPHIDNKVDSDFVSGLLSIDDKMVVLLDIGKIFDVKTLDNAEQAAKNKE